MNSRQSTARTTENFGPRFLSSRRFCFRRREVPVNTEAPNRQRAPRTDEKRSAEGSEVAGLYFALPSRPRSINGTSFLRPACALNGRAKFRKFAGASKGTKGSNRKLREFGGERARRDGGKEGEVKTSRDLFLDGLSLPAPFVNEATSLPSVERCREGE